MKMVALIPARAGSKRIAQKNIRSLGGMPLWRRAVAVARASGLFPDTIGGVVVSTDDEAIIQAPDPQAYVLRRPPELATDDSPDYAWVAHALRELASPASGMLKTLGQSPTSSGLPEMFAILRPTSPFRSVAMLQRAYEQFRRAPDVDSLRAVEPVKQHPGKMWTWAGRGYPIQPLLNQTRSDGTPWHSSPTQSLPCIYMQNASLEMGWTRTVTLLGSIAGKKVAPFFTEGYEGFDINYPEDWERAEQIAAAHPELLEIHVPTPARS